MIRMTIPLLLALTLGACSGGGGGSAAIVPAGNAAAQTPETSSNGGTAPHASAPIEKPTPGAYPVR